MKGGDEGGEGGRHEEASVEVAASSNPTTHTHTRHPWPPRSPLCCLSLSRLLLPLKQREARGQDEGAGGRKHTEKKKESNKIKHRKRKPQHRRHTHAHAAQKEGSEMEVPCACGLCIGYGVSERSNKMKKGAKLLHRRCEESTEQVSLDTPSPLPLPSAEVVA